MKVIFCEHNKCKDEVIKKFKEKFAEHPTEIEECIGCCGDCSIAPIAKVDGRILVGEDIDDLISLISLYI